MEEKKQPLEMGGNSQADIAPEPAFEGVSPGIIPPEKAMGDGCRFSKEQLLSSERFRDRRDILEALLKDGGQYTMKAVAKKINNYMKGKVK